MTDYSCKTFRFGVEDNLFCLRILNDSTFFLKEGILLETIITVYWFGAELKSFILIRLHLAQADLVDRTVHLCMSLFQEKGPYGILRPA